MAFDKIRDNRAGLKPRILKAARKCFFEKGFFASTTREIASSARTSESGIFRHFESKYELLMAVYNDCWCEVNSIIDAKLQKEYSDPRQRINQIIKIVWNLYKEKPLLMTFIIINTGNTDTLILENKNKAIISKENLKYIYRLEVLCQRCVDMKLVSSKLTTRALCEGVLGITEGILLGWYLTDKTDNSYPQKISISEALNLLTVLIHRG